MASPKTTPPPAATEEAPPEGEQPSGETVTVEIPPADPPAEQSPPQPSGRIFTEEEVERIRQQEKDKLYKEIESTKKTVEELQKEADERRKAEEKARKDAEKAAKRAEEEELSAKELIERRDQEWAERFNEVNQRAEVLEATLTKERQFIELERYKNERIAAEEQNIMPELRDLVKGNTQEEIEAAIEFAKTKTDAIVQSIQQATAPPPPPPRAASVTGTPPDGPAENLENATRQLTPEEIKNMPISEYQQLRPQLLQAARQQGPYGNR